MDFSFTDWKIPSREKVSARVADKCTFEQIVRMKLGEKTSIRERILQLEGRRLAVDQPVQERDLLGIVNTLLREKGYGINYVRSNDDGSSRNFASPERTVGRVAHIDFSDNIGIECQLGRKAAPARNDVTGVLGQALAHGFDRVMILSDRPWSQDTRSIVARDFPNKIELVDFESLIDWVDRIPVDETDLLDTYRLLVKNLGRELARLIATSNGKALEIIEWRQLEVVVAEAFEAIGFDVELTRPGKDGGRDVILDCVVNGERKSFIVEVKHWRSGKRVGGNIVADFLGVIVREQREGGLLLSTSGYTNKAFESLSEIERRTLRFGNDFKVYTLCKTMVKVECGIFMPEDQVVDVLFEDTIESQRS